MVLPAQAGVAPRALPLTLRCAGAPRLGGGGPLRSACTSVYRWCSPLRRGWPLGRVAEDALG